MCHVCHRLNIVIKEPPDEERAKAAAEEEAQQVAEIERRDREWAELIVQGIEPPRPHRKVLVPPAKVVVEPAPSHNGAPTYAAYEMRLALLPADPDSPDRRSNSPPSHDGAEEHRPPFGLRIYDTTPTATAERAALLARRISELTYHTRAAPDEAQHAKDRIEVVALPMPASTATTEKGRVERCIAHSEAERAARLSIPDPAVATSWFLPEDLAGLGSRKRLFVIASLQDSWEYALSSHAPRFSSAGSIYGRFYDIGYDDYRLGDDDDVDEEDRPWWASERPGTPVSAAQHLEELGHHLMDFRANNIHQFYVCHFIPQGVMDAELAVARAEAAGVEVPRPIVVRLRP
jgi:hypothetical protein